jgi:hypothetical protein
VVSLHVSGDAAAPDPECPRVIDYRKQHPAAPPHAAVRLPVLA